MLGFFHPPSSLNSRLSSLLSQVTPHSPVLSLLSPSSLLSQFTPLSSLYWNFAELRILQTRSSFNRDFFMWSVIVRLPITLRILSNSFVLHSYQNLKRHHVRRSSSSAVHLRRPSFVRSSSLTFVRTFIFVDLRSSSSTFVRSFIFVGRLSSSFGRSSVHLRSFLWSVLFLFFPFY